ncbi:MAG: DegT/DnrJ/EryC1/StrS family aminotransferase [Bacteroidia bacterium]
MQIPFVDLQAQYQSIKSEIDTAIANVIADNAFISGKYARQFEADFADWLGISHVVACANGTDAIEILLQAMGVGPGDEVIVPAASWFSTSEAVSFIGAKPVFVDVDETYYTINPDLIEAQITERTKAIIPVHLYGQAAAMGPIMEIARKHNLYVLEDCAQAHNAEWEGQRVGTMGHAASFSFYPGKNLGAYGDAGCMVSNDEEIATRARMIANHGQLVKHDHQMEGRNSRMDGIQAAILSAKLPYLKEWTEARRQVARWYDHYLQDSPCEIPTIADKASHVFHLYVVQVEQREALQASLKAAGIPTVIHYPKPLPFLKPYLDRSPSPEEYPACWKAHTRILSLPIFPEMTEEMVQYVAGQIKKSAVLA